MRYPVFLILFLGGCLLDFLPDADELRNSERSTSEDGPRNTRLYAAILGDVRRTRMLSDHLNEGDPDCPAIKRSGSTAICLTDGVEMQVLILRSDPFEQQGRIEETAFYCPKQGIYYYHFEGGQRNLSVWMGPYKIGRAVRASGD